MTCPLGNRLACETRTDPSQVSSTTCHDAAVSTSEAYWYLEDQST